MSDSEKRETNTNRENSLGEYLESMKAFDATVNKDEEPAKKDNQRDDHQDEMNGYEGRHEERRKSLENAFMQTMDPFA
jgi:hypothetical protein